MPENCMLFVRQDYMMMNNKLIIGVAVMASGWGRRFGGNKLMADAGGVPVIERALDLLEPELFAPEDVCVVTRNPDIVKLTEKYGFDAVLHEFPEKSDTVRLGTKALEYADGIMFLQSDQFLVEPDSIRALVEAFEKNPEKPVRLHYGKTYGTPAIFPPSTYAGLESLSGDVGGGAVLKGLNVGLVEAKHEYELWDADTPEELARMVEVIGGR